MLKEQETFFDENIVNVNKKVNVILFYTILVPIIFGIFTALDIWIVPHKYSLFVFLYSTVLSIIYYFLIKINFNQVFLMYLGIFIATGFVFLLGVEGIISITISFAFPPFITCLYYNRNITKYTTILCFIMSCICYWARSYHVPLVLNGVETPVYWFIKNIIGLIIEYFFLFILTDYMSNRTNKTLQTLVKAMKETGLAYNKSEKAYEETKKAHEKTEKAYAALKNKNKQLINMQYKLIQFVARLLDSHDLFTGRHVMHTQKYVEVICKEMVEMGLYKDELTPEYIELFKNAAFLHDIGKIHVPEGILNKIGKFTTEEYEKMKCHTIEGLNLLEDLPMVSDGRFNEIAKQMAYNHHEKWDGTGYPRSIAGIEIPLCARIMAAADVMDALLSQRLYKDPLPMEEAIKIFEESRNTHFESCIVDAVISCKDKILEIDKNFKEEESATNMLEKQWWQRYHKNLQS